MNSVPVPYTPPVEEKPFNVKKAVTITLLTGLGIGAAIFFGTKAVKQKKADKSDGQSFTATTPEYKAKLIKMFLENDNSADVGTDVLKLRHLLTQVSSQEEMNKIREHYKSQNKGNVLDNDLKKDLQSSEFIELSQIIAAKPLKAGQKVNPSVQYKSWAIRLKAAFDKEYGPFSGTDEEAIKAVANEIPTQQAFINTGVAYFKEYQRKMMEDLKDELSSAEWYEVMKIITTKRKN